MSILLLHRLSSDKCSLVRDEEGNIATSCEWEIFQLSVFLLVFLNAWLQLQTADYSGFLSCYINKPLCCLYGCLLNLLTPLYHLFVHFWQTGVGGGWLILKSHLGMSLYFLFWWPWYLPGGRHIWKVSARCELIFQMKLWTTHLYKMINFLMIYFILSVKS